MNAHADRHSCAHQTDTRASRATHGRKDIRLKNRLKTDGIIWDVDGTLWDCTPAVAEAWDQVMAGENSRLAGSGRPLLKLHHPAGGGSGEHVTADDLRREFGRPLDVILNDLYPDTPAEERNRLLPLWFDIENRTLSEKRPRPFEGLEDVLKKLKKKGIPSFVVSNCQAGYIETFFDVTGLGPYFEDHLCPGDTSLLKADNTRIMAERHHLKHAFYIGDIQADCDAARQADSALGTGGHIGFIWASYGFGTVDHPDAVLRQVTDLPDMTESL
jgi:phosphoglycolate phosphatase